MRAISSTRPEVLVEFDAVEIIFLESAGVKTVLESVGVAVGCAAGAVGSGRHRSLR